MLETIREYAAERLDQAACSRETKARHASYYLHLAERAEPRLVGPEQQGWLDRLEAEHDNLRAALRTLLDEEQPVPALRLAAALGPFWRFRGYARAGSPRLEGTLHAAENTLPAERARG